MLIVKVKKNTPGLKKGKKYFVGGMIQNSRNIVLMDMQFNIVPGNYTPETFGSTADEIKETILNGGYELK